MKLKELHVPGFHIKEASCQPVSTECIVLGGAPVLVVFYIFWMSDVAIAAFAKTNLKWLLRSAFIIPTAAKVNSSFFIVVITEFVFSPCEFVVKITWCFVHCLMAVLIVTRTTNVFRTSHSFGLESCKCVKWRWRSEQVLGWSGLLLVTSAAVLFVDPTGKFCKQRLNFIISVLTNKKRIYFYADEWIYESKIWAFWSYTVKIIGNMKRIEIDSELRKF